MYIKNHSSLEMAGS